MQPAAQCDGQRSKSRMPRGAIMDTNLTGMLRACRAFGRHMIERRYAASSTLDR